LEFSTVLYSLRQENGLSQRQAAADLNISQALLSHYEKGIREPRLDFVLRICDYYGVSADYLLGRTSSKDTASVLISADGDLSEELRRLVSACAALAAVCDSMGQVSLARECLSSIGFSVFKLCRLLELDGSVSPAFSARADSLSKAAEAQMLDMKDSIDQYAQVKGTALQDLSERSPALCRALKEFADSYDAYFNPTR